VSHSGTALHNRKDSDKEYVSWEAQHVNLQLLKPASLLTEALFRLRMPSDNTCKDKNVNKQQQSSSSRFHGNRPPLACYGLIHPGDSSMDCPDFLYLLVTN
jgi:hypothetical protein